MATIRTKAYLDELNAEYRATRACLERIPESMYEFKPHPTSMKMSYLVLLVVEIPLWIKHMIIDGEIDFQTFQHANPTTTQGMLDVFEEGMKAAREALNNTDDEALQEKFTLKASGKVLYSSPKIIDIGTTLNHWVHHRGQLTVYMRMNEIPVPSLYGPSADDQQFKIPG